MLKKNILCTIFTAALLAAVLLLSLHFKEPSSGSFFPAAFSFSGGSGRVSISCERVILNKGDTEAVIVFSSPDYSYVKVDDRVYQGSYTEKTSTFRIPAVLDSEFTVKGCTTAMSTPHEIEYRLFVSLDRDKTLKDPPDGADKDKAEDREEIKTGVRARAAEGFSDSEAPDIPGHSFIKRLEPEFARYFDVFYYDGGLKCVAVADGSFYLCIPDGKEVPEGLPDNVTVIKAPQKIYVAATGAMSLFDALGAVDRIGFSGTEEKGWYIDAPKDAMKNGSIIFAGKYSAPDYELLLKGGADLSVESTMILHSPETAEKLRSIGIPVFTDYSSYEDTAAGKGEWIYAYAAMLDKEKEADRAFKKTLDAMKEYEGYQKSGKSAAFFYINNGGLAIIRGDRDYITDLIIRGGAGNAFAGAGEASGDSAGISLSMESFYEMACDADFIIYNTTIDGSVSSREELLKKSEVLKDFKAVKNDDIFLLGKEFYQSTDRLYELSGDINKIINGSTEDLTFLKKAE